MSVWVVVGVIFIGGAPNFGSGNMFFNDEANCLRAAEIIAAQVANDEDVTAQGWRCVKIDVIDKPTTGKPKAKAIPNPKVAPKAPNTGIDGKNYI